jgi:hypothetical protein
MANRNHLIPDQVAFRHSVLNSARLRKSQEQLRQKFLERIVDDSDHRNHFAREFIFRMSKSNGDKL